jgi:hypothetical protein
MIFASYTVRAIVFLCEGSEVNGFENLTCIHVCQLLSLNETKLFTVNLPIPAKLNKALYGCLVSAKLWYDHMSGILRALGFCSNPYDVCAFNKTHDDR